jgi:hypothetical protein
MRLGSIDCRIINELHPSLRLAGLFYLVYKKGLSNQIRRLEVKKKLSLLSLIAVLLLILTSCASGTVAQINTPVPGTNAGTPAPNGQINVPGVSIQVYVPGPNPLVNTADPHGSPAGVLLGIWHGVISPVTMVISFINKDIQMYEVHNDGSQYNLGFLIGVVILFIIFGVIFGSRRR